MQPTQNPSRVIKINKKLVTIISALIVAISTIIAAKINTTNEKTPTQPLSITSTPTFSANWSKWDNLHSSEWTTDFNELESYGTALCCNPDQISIIAPNAPITSNYVVEATIKWTEDKPLVSDAYFGLFVRITDQLNGYLLGVDVAHTSKFAHQLDTGSYHSLLKGYDPQYFLSKKDWHTFRLEVKNYHNE